MKLKFFNKEQKEEVQNIDEFVEENSASDETDFISNMAPMSALGPLLGDNSYSMQKESQELKESDSEPETEELEELEDDVEVVEPEEDIAPSNSRYFSMTQFGFAVVPAEELDDADKGKVFVEKNGVFSISKNADYSDFIQDPDFKSLVDSVLHS